MHLTGTKTTPSATAPDLLGPYKLPRIETTNPITDPMYLRKTSLTPKTPSTPRLTSILVTPYSWHGRRRRRSDRRHTWSWRPNWDWRHSNTWHPRRYGRNIVYYIHRVHRKLPRYSPYPSPPLPLDGPRSLVILAPHPRQTAQLYTYALLSSSPPKTSYNT